MGRTAWPDRRTYPKGVIHSEKKGHLPLDKGIEDSIKQGEDDTGNNLYNVNMSTRILLVSRGMFHDGLLRALKNYADDVEILGSASTWSEAQALIRERKPQVLVADYQLAPEMMGGLEELAAEEEIPAKILFIILDENKIIVYQRRQFTDITLDKLIERLESHTPR